MNTHLSEEELILHYYGETDRADEARMASHLAQCGDCQQADTQLRRVLALVETAAPVEPRRGFERDVWARLEPTLGEALTTNGEPRTANGEPRRALAHVLLVSAVGARRRMSRLTNCLT